jgi:hypothetical protein
MSRLSAVAHGGVGDDQWTIRVGGDVEDLYTILIVELANGHILGGGIGGGPVLQPGRAMEFCTGIGDDGPLYLVGRADPAITRIRVEAADQSDTEVATSDVSHEFGVRFFATLLPRQSRLMRVTALDGRQIERDVSIGRFALVDHLPPSSWVG